ncbi:MULTISPECIES: YhcN/YlaJ family sporulation lipoprotein [Priestia]|jgi:YhcN/YlaJ family sporulation lipoprotein|uniref:YhcN/YlaJ family sporulation lipoprotein n=1 Tax=Priestia TaxID=2800373 RepID=UPI00087E22FE|nr:MULTISPECIES: YhcN/YlaJ family sporulation lipoprotein [Priestia]SDC84927.1 sporulation lipoprotein, YhcN/YlaJ family [Priestia aryabhattai B8W22]MBE2976122.1 YhcN/YlaJ family sporulation lipoprotein [Priestia megaterium]MBT2256690.1 YhcN/YlaJ family sporulation lipoprotein [Priestia megaterium]MBT2278417.1 YhcN/YlaJ family sporulation lipoprotein [Priestia megaterium]MBX9986527.1 YhcN/YlaJ family sporulation lipoprotein [Priestia aryabhattai]
MNKFFLSISLCFITLTGCNNNQADVEEGQKTDRIVQVKNSSPERSHKRTANEISAHLVELASSVPNVNDATAIVLGKYAIVGIDVGKNIDRSEVSSIKYTVAEGLKADPYGANSVVIADPDTVARLKQIGNEIRKGRPVTGFLDELAAIVNRVMPEFAEEIRRNPSSTDTNNQKLNNKQEQNLKNEQEKQSNNHLQKNE